MFADLPPPTPALTAEQRADLDCLQVLLMVAEEAPNSPDAQRMVREYLKRLRRTDPKRDWAKLAPAEPDMLYGEFMGRMNRCHDESRRREPRRRD